MTGSVMWRGHQILDSQAVQLLAVHRWDSLSFIDLSIPRLVTSGPESNFFVNVASKKNKLSAFKVCSRNLERKCSSIRRNMIMWFAVISAVLLADSAAICHITWSSYCTHTYQTVGPVTGGACFSRILQHAKSFQYVCYGPEHSLLVSFRRIAE